MKKIVPVLLGLTLAASLTACATKTVKEAPTAAPQTTAAAMEETTEAPAETSGAETEAAAKQRTPSLRPQLTILKTSRKISIWRL